ncbi:alginate lyase family protein [Brenneria goodwinii]|nr:alginate lyase family protein [Brenneria goodwinii]MCG8160772.1 alginate lyase family protein [Brenneria goodwinii]MCG8165898.1 alginate lyase family protein [Brenneria goodwinii]MCG8170386.1 alginate lyase family protein [Brenneria goodwinii]MCG8175254.1 alginate lyase family protein [Brenneria goodwinii]
MTHDSRRNVLKGVVARENTRLRYLLLFSASLWSGVATISSADEANTPYAFLAPSQLASAKQQLQLHTAKPQTRLAYRQLLAQADRVLKITNPNVTQKRSLPPSGSKHDYLSLSAYWWPDPSKAEGLPWIRRDGQVNPAS